MLTCKEVSRTIASDDLAEAGLRRRLAVRFHLWMCRHCRRYATQMRQLGDMARGMFRGRSEDPETLARLQNQILEQTGVNKAKDRS